MEGAENRESDMDMEGAENTESAMDMEGAVNCMEEPASTSKAMPKKGHSYFRLIQILLERLYEMGANVSKQSWLYVTG